MLDTTHFLPDGTQLLVEGEAQDIVRRLRDGDPALGWEGDPSLRVFVVTDPADFNYGKFEVWGVDALGEPYLAITSRTCGPELIRHLMDSDNRRRNVLAEAMKKREKKQADADAERRERMDEVADKLHFALIRENGGTYGGLTRRIH